MRCQGTTRKGKPCMNGAMAMQRYCGPHLALAQGKSGSEKPDSHIVRYDLPKPKPKPKPNRQTQADYIAAHESEAHTEINCHCGKLIECPDCLHMVHHAGQLISYHGDGTCRSQLNGEVIAA